jgi:ABC-2 type transport system permease protein
MRSFKAALANEVFKMTRKKKPVLILILSVVSIATVLLIILALRGGLGIMGSTAASFPITVLSVVANTILPLFTALAVIDAFTGEFAADTMKICIAKPVTRLKIYLAKLASVGLLILASLLAVMILSMAVSLLVLRLTPTLAWVTSILAAYLATAWPLFTLAVIVAWPANVLKSSAGVFFLSLLAFLFLKVLALVITPLAGLLSTSLLDWYKLWIARPVPMGTLLRQWLAQTAQILIFFALGFRRFDRRDL